MGRIADEGAALRRECRFQSRERLVYSGNQRRDFGGQVHVGQACTRHGRTDRGRGGRCPAHGAQSLPDGPNTNKDGDCTDDCQQGEPGG